MTDSVPEQLAKYVAALVQGTHEITSVTIQPKRTWVGLTDEDWNRSKHSHDFQKGVDWAEAKLKEKNT